MTSGGARARSGPARDPRSLRSGRRADNGGFLRFANVAREGGSPRWPLPAPTRWERARWEEEWRRPIAVAWEQFGLEVQVAVYVRTLYRATQPKAASGLMKTAASLMDQLGLTVGGLAKNRWILEEATPPAAAPRRPASATAKDRMKVIEGGADARAS